MISVSRKFIPNAFAANTPSVLFPAPGIPISIMFIPFLFSRMPLEKTNCRFSFCRMQFLRLSVFILVIFRCPVKADEASKKLIYIIQYVIVRIWGNVMDKLGKNVRKYRKQLGLSQADLAIKMGYKSRSSINKIELGENDIPLSKILAFVKVLNTTPALLMGWGDEEQLAIKTNNELEKETIRCFRSLSESQKLEVLRYLHYLSESTNKK